MPEPLNIVGGGLAGLTLGILLRRRGIAVEILEAGHFPRHKVCGEFISGRGIAILESLGSPINSEVRLASTVSFYNAGGRIFTRALPSPAWVISRHSLDAALAQLFERQGGILHCGTRVRDPGPAPGRIRATGRRLASPSQGKASWFGVKCHVEGCVLESDLEMHLMPGGYVGLCTLPDGAVNVCALFRRKPGQPSLSRDWLGWLASLPSPIGSRLGKSSVRDATLCSVAGIGFSRQQSIPGECLVGDALGMIPPVTGNGMSIAFESAQLATDPLTQYARGEQSWNDTCRQIRCEMEERFSRRLAWAARLQALMFLGTPGRILFAAARRFEFPWNFCLQQVR